jgi:hypothetical protein
MRTNSRSGVQLGVFLVLAAMFALPSRAMAATIQVLAAESLQPALDAAQPGDVILLQAGATFVGNFVLPVKPGAGFIVIRSAASDQSLPVNGQRIGPKWASLLPKLRSDNSMAVLRTAPGTHHWRLQFLEFQGNKDGFGDMIQLGDGSSRQNSLAAVPHDIELDRVYIHGDPLVGQKRCVALNASAVTIRSSFISDCKAVGQEAQAVGGWNGPGPYWLENNYLEGAGENVMFGGADPSIPGLAASDVTFRRNHLSKPLAWRHPIIPTPTSLTATPGSGGTLPVGRFTYFVVARRSVGQGAMGRSTAASVGATVGANGKVQLNWAAVRDATDYQVFARGFSWTVTAPAFTDTGAKGTTASPPSGQGTVWLVKNLFELKNARRVTVEYNVFESNWPSGQSGYAILFTPRNSQGSCNWCAVQDVTFQYNIVRQVPSAINLLGYDSPGVSAQTTNIRIRHNLFYDVSAANWGGNGWFLLIGDEPRTVVVDHNTIDHDGGSLVYAYGKTASGTRPILGFQFTNNLARHNNYGINGASYAYGTGVISAYFPDGIVVRNLLSGGPANRYPPNNYFSTDFQSLFINQVGGDYRLSAASFARGRASDGGDLGADIPTLLAGIQGVVSATPSTGQPITSVPRTPQHLRLVR